MSSETGAKAAAVKEPSPHDLVKHDDVQKALTADQGNGAVLNKFSMKDFTSSGDNYACYVSSVELSYTKDGRSFNTSYVVKLNPGSTKGFAAMLGPMFSKEIGFYTQILPLINKELTAIKEKPLRVPKYLYSKGEPSGEVIFMEDLRNLSYKMFDRKKGMDKAHTHLILKELARLHAASILLLSRDEYKNVDILEKFPILVDLMQHMQKDGNEEDMNKMFDQFAENNAKLVDGLEGYEYVAEYMRKMIEEKSYETMKDQYAMRSPFKMITHGDCWNNNFLFRYGRNGEPVECRLVDWQVTRVASPGLDLNYMLYCSLEGSMRTVELPSLLAIYYASYASVLSRAGVCPEFTLPQLHDEFYSKNLYGMSTAMMLIPLVLRDEDASPDMNTFEGENIQEQMLDFQQKLIKTIHLNPLLRPRLLSVFDEMKENGLFKQSSVTKLVRSFSKTSM